MDCCSPLLEHLSNDSAVTFVFDCLSHQQIVAVSRNMAGLTSPKKSQVDPSSPKQTKQMSQNESGLLPPQHWGQLSEVGDTSPKQVPELISTKDIDNHDDADSTIPDNASSTASITSSILKYRTLHGRLYQSERGNTDYWFVKSFA